MNKRQVIILWVIAIALGVAVAAVKISQKESTASATQRTPGETLFESFPAEEVAVIEIEGADEATTLRKEDGAWVVVDRDGYPANTAGVNEFLRSLNELKVSQGIEAGPSFAPRFGMDPEASAAEDRGITAVFKDAAGTELAAVSFGKSIEGGAPASPFGGGAAGRYVRNHADESGFYAVSEMFPSLSAEPQRWLQEGFLQIEKIQSITVTNPGGEGTAWEVARESEDGDFSLVSSVGDEAADPTAATSLKNLFSNARFDDVLPADQVDERVETEQQRTAVIETFEGLTYTIEFAPLRQTEAPAAEGDEPAPPAADTFSVTVEVAAELPAERKPEEGETEEDAKAKEAAFAERHKVLSERLSKEQKLAGRVFVVSKYTVDPLLKTRAELAAPAETSAASLPPPQPQPQPGTPTTRQIEAVTPPIAIPPLDQELEAIPEPEPAPAEPEAEVEPTPADETPAATEEQATEEQADEVAEP